LWHALLPPGDTAPSDAQVLQQTPVHEWEPTLSPSGKFLAYSQGDVGQSQVMLRGYPETSGQWQVSVSGGSKPLWSPTGDKLYFRDVPGQILVVDVATTPKVSLSAPRVIQRPSILIARAGFDISADGKRLLIPRIVKTNDDRTPSLTVIQNWLAEFKKTRRVE
jgi:Tol biopolymer transport system component